MPPREAKRCTAALRSPLTRQFIGTSKLLMSSQFDEAAEFAISQRFALNDITFIHALLDVFSTSPSCAALLHWFCDRGALSFSVGTSRLRLHLSESTRTTSANLVEYLSIHKGNKQTLISPREPTARYLTRSEDSWLGNERVSTGSKGR